MAQAPSLRVARLARRLVPGVLGGFAGTAVMTATGAAYARLRGPLEPDADGATPIIDWDRSDHVVVAAATLLRYHPRTPAGRRALFHLVHWGYGSVFGVVRLLLGFRLREPGASTAFFLAGQTVAVTLLPLLGRTPPPWRWTGEQLAVSLVQHAIYAGAVGAVVHALGERHHRARHRPAPRGTSRPRFR